METSSSPSPSTPALPMVPPAGQPGGLSKMHQEPTAGPEGLPIEAASNKSSVSPSSSSRAIVIPQSRDSIYLRREKDIAPVNPVPPRTDSIDSYRFRRTDTTWSVFTHASTITDATEPPSPDTDNFHDEPMIFDDTNQETYASSPRPFGNPGRTVTFHQDNCRPSHCSSSPDNTPLPRHSDILRLQNRSSSPRRGILRSSTGFNPTRPSSGPRRGSNQWPGPLAHRPRLTRRTIEESEDRPSSLQDTPELPTPTEPTEPTEPVAKTEDHSGTGMLRQIQQDALGDVGQSSLSVEDTQTDDAAPEEMSDTSDSVGDIGTPSSTTSGSRPDDQMVQDTCDHVLRNVFGVDLQELGVTGAASAAYNSVHYCLDELSQIVPAENSVGQSSPPLREVPNYGTTRGGGHAPIQPGNGGDYNGYQIGGGAGGGGGGGGGGQKRPIGDGDQGDQPRKNGKGGGDGSGGRDNGGGGKRPKVAAAEPPEDQELSCPFRKRNPVKFNVRDHQSCAVQSFPDISQLKRHVKNFHKQRSVSVFACPRCKQDMMNKEGVDNHLAVPNESICTPQEAPPVQNPEDGITSRIEDVLNGRKANTKVDTWEVLWPTLFPDDQIIPKSHFVPPVELEEVHFQFRNSMDDLEARIREAEQNANDYSQSLDDRVAQILGSCTAHIEYVIELSRLQADNAPGRPRRLRSHGHGHNPKPSTKGKSPDTGGSEKFSSSSGTASPIGQRRFSQQLLPPEATQPHPIPKQRQGQRLSGGESNLSSSLDTANSDESWVDTQPRGQEAVPAMPTQPLDQYVGLNLDTNNVNNTDVEDLPLSAVTSGPAGSPAYPVSPLIGHGGGSVIPPPQQVHLRNGAENGFQLPPSGGPTQTPVTNVLGSQLHNRTDSAIAGLDATQAPYFRPTPTFQNTNNMDMFPAGPSPFQGMSPGMGYGHPTGQQFHPQQLQQIQMQMQMRIRQAQFQAAKHQQVPVPVTVPGGTIDPRMINTFGVGPSMGMGNNGNNNGHGFSSFSPGGADGIN